MSSRKLTPFRRKYLRFNVSEQRRLLKLKAIEYKGGKCSDCGYCACPAAMVFHHINDSEKDFGIADGNSRNFEKIKGELDKCILLCSNCHAEKHFKEDEIVRENKRKEIEGEIEGEKYSRLAQR